MKKMSNLNGPFLLSIIITHVIQLIKANTNKLTIFISTQEDFLFKAEDSSIYKIITNKKSSFSNLDPLPIIYANKENDLYNKKNAYGMAYHMNYIWKNYI